jgi:ribose/xylose/arabinose/galactoside ABC-type transport system permease subunit
MTHRIANQHARPFLIFAACVVFLALLNARQHSFLTMATAFSTLQLFATLGPVALGLGIGMMVQIFDLSIAGTFALGGVIAVMTGGVHPFWGALLAVTAGAAIGIGQAVIMVRLRLPAIGVSLGGLLTCIGLSYVLTGSRSIDYPNLDVAEALNNHIFGVFSARSLFAIAIFVVAAAIVGWTRIGRDLIAFGNDPRAARVAGVNVDRLLIGIFALSGASAAFAGAILSYSLASASPSGLSDVLVSAAAAAILGGVSLVGGSGRPLGIALGVLTLSVLRSGLNASGAEPFLHDITIGAVLLVVAVSDGRLFMTRAKALQRWFADRSTPV